MTQPYRRNPWRLDGDPMCFTEEQGRASTRRFIALIPRRLDYLATVTDISWVFSRRPLAEIKEPFRRFCDWIESMPYVKKGRMGRGVLILSREAEQYREEIERRHDENQVDWIPTSLGDSLCTDLEMVVGEYFRLRFPWLYWTMWWGGGIDKYDRCLVGGGAAGDPVVHIAQRLAVAMSGAKDHDPPTLYDKLMDERTLTTPTMSRRWPSGLVLQFEEEMRHPPEDWEGLPRATLRPRLMVAMRAMSEKSRALLKASASKTPKATGKARPPRGSGSRKAKRG